MRNFVRGALVASMAILAVGPAWGQPGNNFSPALLLQNEGVRHELKLSAEQSDTLKKTGDELGTKYKEEFGKLKELKGAEQREKFQEVMKKMSDEADLNMASILKPEQVKRLKQIQLQQRGAGAFNDPAIQKELTLTEDQLKKIQDIQADAGKQLAAIFQSAKGKPDEIIRQFADLHQKTTQKAVDVLTEEQKKIWVDLTGEPFELKWGPTPGRALAPPPGPPLPRSAPAPEGEK